MTSNDVGRWCAEQNKDLVSISRHHSHIVVCFNLFFLGGGGE